MSIVDVNNSKSAFCHFTAFFFCFACLVAESRADEKAMEEKETCIGSGLLRPTPSSHLSASKQRSGI